jgi:hypothetical protein
MRLFILRERHCGAHEPIAGCQLGSLVVARLVGRYVRFVPKVFPYTWVAEKALPQLTEHRASFKKSPPIPPGTPDPYVPPKAD